MRNLPANLLIAMVCILCSFQGTQTLNNGRPGW